MSCSWKESNEGSRRRRRRKEMNQWFSQRDIGCIIIVLLLLGRSIEDFESLSNGREFPSTLLHHAKCRRTTASSLHPIQWSSIISRTSIIEQCARTDWSLSLDLFRLVLLWHWFLTTVFDLHHMCWLFSQSISSNSNYFPFKFHLYSRRVHNGRFQQYYRQYAFGSTSRYFRLFVNVNNSHVHHCILCWIRNLSSEMVLFDLSPLCGHPRCRLYP